MDFLTCLFILKIFFRQPKNIKQKLLFRSNNDDDDKKFHSKTNNMNEIDYFMCEDEWK